MTNERLEFEGAQGDVLRARLARPADRDVRAYALFAHCFTCSKDLKAAVNLSRALTEAGFGVLRFDFTGLGESGGEFAETTLSNDVRDLTAAARALIQRDLGPCGLLGHSLGGAASLLAAHRLKTVRSVVVVGTPASPAHVRRLLSDREPTIRREGEAIVEIAGRPFPIRASFLDELEDYDQQARVAELDRPLLVLHAVDDEVVDIEQGERIFAAAHQPKGFMPLLGADHLLSDRTSSLQAVGIVAGWFDRTL